MGIMTWRLCCVSTVAMSESNASELLNLLEAVPELCGDPDLSAINEGVTIVWLK